MIALNALGTVELCTGSRMRSLITEDGRVTGVVTEENGATRRISAARGVIVAAGEWECDDELRGTTASRTGEWTSSAPGLQHRRRPGGPAGAAIDLMDEARRPPPRRGRRSLRPFSSQDRAVCWQGRIP
jgi:3-oxosteroid 1-dehydrogenase